MNPPRVSTAIENIAKVPVLLLLNYEPAKTIVLFREQPIANLTQLFGWTLDLTNRVVSKVRARSDSAVPSQSYLFHNLVQAS